MYHTDAYFDKIYKLPFQDLAGQHWTPISVARKAAGFLATHEGAKVLDIGSGVGKFCFAAAQSHPKISWFGVEQRHHLVKEARRVKKQLAIPNVTFIDGNFTQMDFRSFDHFYFFNSFYENLKGKDHIDETVDCSEALYTYYSNYLYRQLEKMPSGTRLASFHSLEDAMPHDYKIVGVECNELLTYWIKV